jgi:hypothetical protein
MRGGVGVEVNIEIRVGFRGEKDLILLTEGTGGIFVMVRGGGRFDRGTGGVHLDGTSEIVESGGRFDWGSGRIWGEGVRSLGGGRIGGDDGAGGRLGEVNC